ncbi:MAG: mechanosensitive ion channel [Candidatus Woesearchaeota archaeon]
MVAAYASNFSVFLLILFVSIVLGYLVYMIFKHWCWKWAKSTPTLFDDILVDDIEEPFVVLIVLAGLYFGADYIVMNPLAKLWYFRFLLIGAVINLGYFLVKFTSDLISAYLEPIVKKTKTLVDDFYLNLFSRVYTLFIILMCVLIIFAGMGINVKWIIIITGVAFAIILGFMMYFLIRKVLMYDLFASGFFEEGDIIEIPTQKLLGIVEKYTLTYTFLRDAKGNKIIVPNKLIESTPIRVYKVKKIPKGKK